MTETKLKPCPFCGGKPDLGSYSSSGNWIVVCSKCEAETQVYETEQEVVKAWNARQVEGELLKKYEAALFEICFCCAAVDCSLEQQSEALKAIDTICKEFYSIQEGEE